VVPGLLTCSAPRRSFSVRTGAVSYESLLAALYRGESVIAVPGEMEGFRCVVFLYRDLPPLHVLFAAHPDRWVRGMYAVSSVCAAHRRAREAGVVT
jgi:hypothetical protein